MRLFGIQGLACMAFMFLSGYFKMFYSQKSRTTFASIDLLCQLQRIECWVP